MTATLPTADGTPVPGRQQPARLRTTQVALALMALLLAGLLGYRIGARQNSDTHILTGWAFTTGSQVAVRVNGWVYGFDITSDMDWYDSRGGSHEGGTPPCLRRPGDRHVWLRFGYSVAVGLHGDGWRPVDWVQCLPGQR